MKIDFTNDMSRDDYRELLYFNLLHRKKWFKYVFILMTLISASGVLAGVLGAIEKGYYFYVSMMSLVMIMLLYFQIEGIAKRFDKNTTFKNGFCRPFTVDEEGIKSPVADGTLGCVPWASVTNGYETGLHFLFYIGARQAITLVKRSMTGEQSAQLTQLAASKLQAKFDVRIKKTQK